MPDKLLVFKTDTNRLEYEDKPSSSPSGGAGHITILPLSYDSVGQGTWTIYLSSGSAFGHVIYNTSDTDGDSLLYKVYLDAGTYSFQVLTSANTQLGIMSIDIDETQVASFDCYNTPALTNVIKREDGIVISEFGLKTLKVYIDGKNSSASHYYSNIQYMALWKTA